MTAVATMPSTAPSTTVSTTDCNAPIGLFDSGVGGLSVYQHLQKKLPNERFIYYADTANVPYGAKSASEIINLSHQAVSWLIACGCKLIIVACNSASAFALPSLRAAFDIPIVGLVPAVKPAVQLSHTHKIAVLATHATLTGQLFLGVVQEIATPAGTEVLSHFEPRLVPWVESGMPITHEVADLLISQMHAWYQDGVDVLVLGCTHYPFFKDFLQQEINKSGIKMTLIDSGQAIAERVHSLLNIANMLATTPNTLGLQLHATANTEQTHAIASALIGQITHPINNHSIHTH
ncbi:MAG: glutamate racemase [Moraxella sp.]|nr:glutamate racemase [Moraxella sp.]